MRKAPYICGGTRRRPCSSWWPCSSQYVKHPVRFPCSVQQGSSAGYFSSVKALMQWSTAVLLWCSHHLHSRRRWTSVQWQWMTWVVNLSGSSVLEENWGHSHVFGNIIYESVSTFKTSSYIWEIVILGLCLSFYVNFPRSRWYSIASFLKYFCTSFSFCVVIM